MVGHDVVVDPLDIRIKIALSQTGFGPGLALASSRVTKFEQTVNKSLDRVKKAFTGLSTQQKILAGAGLGLGVLALGFSKVIGPAIDFESAFAGVLKTVDGSTAQLANIRVGLLNLSTIMPTSATQLAAIAENAGQLGIAAGDVVEFTKVIAQLGETTDLDFEQAAQSLARFLNVTGNKATITQLGDVIVELGNNSATTESQILTFATRLASAFNIAGATEDEILAIGAAFSSLGIEAEAGASALSRVITQIADAAILGGGDLEVFAETAGLLPEQFAAIAKESPVEAMLLFGEGLKGVTEQGRSITPILKSLELDGIRTSRVMQLLATGSDDIRTSLELASDQFENGGAAAEEFAKRAETTASRLELLRNRLTAVAILTGTPLLGGLARGADEAGDAIARLSAILGPLASELGVTFGNLAEVAALFFEVIGGPALKAGVAGLTGVTVVATQLLAALNGLGPAGLVIAALLLDLALVGPVTSAAVLAVDRLAASLLLVGARGTAAAAGLRAVSLAASAGPWILLAVAVASIGAAFIEAGEKAREAGELVQNNWNKALESGNYAKISNEISGVRDRMASLRELDKVPDTLAAGFDGWTAAIKSSAQILTPFTENTALNARAELEALEEQVDAVGWEGFNRGVTLAAESLGLSRDTVVALGAETGTLSELVDGSTEGFGRFFEAVSNASVAERELADSVGIAADKILAETATLEDYALVLGITVSELELLAGQLKDVDLSDGIDGEELTELEALRNEFGALSDQLGITLGDFLAQANAVDGLAASHSGLRKAIDGTLSAYELIDSQIRTVSEATESYDKAISKLDGSEEQLIASASATRVLSAESAGLAASADHAALNQQKLITQFAIAALEAGHTADEVIRATEQYAALDNASLAKIVQQGVKLQGQNEEVKRTAEELVGDYLMTLLADGDQAEGEISARKNQGDAFANGGYKAFLEANGVSAQSTIQSAKDAGLGYARKYSSVLTATDRASSSIFAAVRALRGFRSKTIYLRTVTVARGSRGRAFADGGITDIGSIGLPAGAVVERPGAAKIYQPTTPFRAFAEPVTGGEAYIPLSATKRGSAIPVWQETGRLLGMMENGGIQGFQSRAGDRLARLPALPRGADPGFEVNIDFTINTTPGMDEQRVAELAGAKVTEVLDNAALRLRNTRI